MAANKRALKKEIHRICGAIAGECVLARLTVPGIDHARITELIYQLAELQDSALRLVQVDFPGNTRTYGSKQEYARARREYFQASYRRLREHFNSRVQQIVAEMNAAVPGDGDPEARKAAMRHLTQPGCAE